MDVHSRKSAVGHRIVHVRVDGVHNPIRVLLAPDVRSIDTAPAQIAPPLVLGFIPLMPRRIDHRAVSEETSLWADQVRHRVKKVALYNWDGLLTQIALTARADMATEYVYVYVNICKCVSDDIAQRLGMKSFCVVLTRSLAPYRVCAPCFFFIPSR